MKTQRGIVPPEDAASGARADDGGQGPSIPHEDSRSAGAGQLRFYQILSATLIVLLASSLVYVLYRQHKTAPVAVLVAGRPITTVINYSAAQALVPRLAQAELGSAYGVDVRTTSPVLFQRVAQDTPVDAQSTAISKLAAAVHLTVVADVISISGAPVVALPNQPAAQAALDEVRNHYASLPPSDTLIGRPEFREHVSIDRVRTKAAICKPTADAAAQVLITAPPAKQYSVGFHETGWSIARKFHMSFSDFVRANAGRDLNDLRPGDMVNVSRSFPPLTAIVHKERVFTQPIERGAPASVAGLRQITTIDTYVNGVRTGESSPVSVFTIRKAVPRSIVE